MIGFVILHYQIIEDTTECINSIMRNINDPFIVVVDNNSPNKSGYILAEKYKSCENIKVIINSSNFGFSKGLNVGIEWFNSNLNCKYICLLNNDTVIINNNWECSIERAFEEYNFDVLGPDIVNLEGAHCNPRKRRKYNTIIVFLMMIKTFLELLYLVLFKKSLNNNNNDMYFPNWKKCDPDAELQGSCFILSSKFFIKQKCLFDETRFYSEECILRYLCDVNSQKMVYFPEIVLLHKEGKATNEVNSAYEKRKFVLKNTLYSRYRFFLLTIKTGCLFKRNH